MNYYFDIEKYVDEIENNKINEIKDKLGSNISIGDEVTVKDMSNYSRNIVTGIVTKCFIKKKKPMIRVQRVCSKFEEKIYQFSNKKMEDEQISFLCVKNSTDLEEVPLD